MNDTILYLNSKKLFYFIPGDINLNTKFSVRPSSTSQYLNMLTSNCAASIIDRSTRITPTCVTTLDHIITNENRFELFPAVIQYELTDHYPIGVAIYRK